LAAVAPTALLTGLCGVERRKDLPEDIFEIPADALGRRADACRDARECEFGADRFQQVVGSAREQILREAFEPGLRGKAQDAPQRREQLAPVAVFGQRRRIAVLQRRPRVARELPSVYAVGWINLYDEPPTTYGGLFETDGAKKPGYFAWKDG
jgi:hypothetical protein